MSYGTAQPYCSAISRVPSQFSLGRRVFANGVVYCVKAFRAQFVLSFAPDIDLAAASRRTELAPYTADYVFFYKD
jgi:hypothetical protein